MSPLPMFSWILCFGILTMGVATTVQVSAFTTENGGGCTEVEETHTFVQGSTDLFCWTVHNVVAQSYRLSAFLPNGHDGGTFSVEFDCTDSANPQANVYMGSTCSGLLLVQLPTTGTLLESFRTGGCVQQPYDTDSSPRVKLDQSDALSDVSLCRISTTSGDVRGQGIACDFCAAAGLFRLPGDTVLYTAEERQADTGVATALRCQPVFDSPEVDCQELLSNSDVQRRCCSLAPQDTTMPPSSSASDCSSLMLSSPLTLFVIWTFRLA
jgi:hypothetical protein